MLMHVLCARRLHVPVHARRRVSRLRGFYHTGEDEKENEGKRTYYRVLCVDASEDGAIDKLRDDIFAKVFHNMATRVVVETKFEEETHVSELVTSLRELPCLHFTQ